MKIKFFALIAVISALSCNSPKKENESKASTGVDTVKVVPKEEPVTQGADSSSQSTVAKAENKTAESKDTKTEQKTTKKDNITAKDDSGTLPDPGTIPFEKSTPIPFKDFHAKTLKALPTVRLPLNLEQAAGKVKVHAYPMGSFEMPNGFNAERMMVGMLPDTSTYYGIVWKGYLPDPRSYTTPGKQSVAYLTTFTKLGKMISNTQVQLETYPEGPSDCGNYKSDLRSVIQLDYTFESTHISSYKCEGEAQPRMTTEKLVGNVERNGTVVVHRSNGETAKSGGQ